MSSPTDFTPGPDLDKMLCEWMGIAHSKWRCDECGEERTKRPGGKSKDRNHYPLGHSYEAGGACGRFRPVYPPLSTDDTAAITLLWPVAVKWWKAVAICASEGVHSTAIQSHKDCSESPSIACAVEPTFAAALAIAAAKALRTP